MLRWGKDSSGLAAQGESHPGVRLRGCVNGVVGVVGNAMRKPLSRVREEGRFSPSVGLRSSLWENPILMMGLLSSRLREGSAPNTSDGSIGRRRVNGNQRCSPLGPAEEFCDTPERRASDRKYELPRDGGS